MSVNNRLVLEIEQVSFAYNGSAVLSNVNLTVQRGDYVGLIGPNGSGKTTLLRILLGLIKPKKGSVRLFGREVEKFNQWNLVGYIPQKVTQIENRFPITVGEVVGLGMVGSGGWWGRGRANTESVDEALARVGMGAYKKALIHELSGGQQQRVFIAKALITEPELLILDEPTVGIDNRSEEAFYTLLEKLHAGGTTIILVSHDIEVVAREVTSLACLNKTLVYHGEPQGFMEGQVGEALYGKGKKLVVHGHTHG